VRTQPNHISHCAGSWHHDRHAAVWIDASRPPPEVPLTDDERAELNASIRQVYGRPRLLKCVPRLTRATDIQFLRWPITIVLSSRSPCAPSPAEGMEIRPFDKLRVVMSEAEGRGRGSA
jgi:hypothetical protein